MYAQTVRRNILEKGEIAQYWQFLLSLVPLLTYFYIYEANEAKTWRYREKEVKCRALLFQNHNQ